MTERLLQICVAIMAVLGTILLGLEQRDAMLPLATIVVVISSSYLTDRKDWFALPRVLANAIAVVAVIYTVVRLVGQPTESQLLAVANLLVYLQIILFYQRKTVRLYWQLLTLSFLQVVVAAALNLVFVFGILLIIYLFVALAALSAFYLHREQLYWLAAPGAGTPTLVFATSPAGATNGASRRTARMPPAPLRWRTICWQAGWLGSMTLIATAVMFFFLPRQEAFWRNRSSRQRVLVGYSDEVNLEELGPILESPEMVMRVSFTDPANDQPYRIWGEPYFRGAVLDTYSPGHGIWRRPNGGISLRPLPPSSSLRNLVRQDIMLEPGDHSVIFAVAPVCSVWETPHDVMIEQASQAVVPKDPDRMDPKNKYRFVAATYGFQRGVQLALLPDIRPGEGSQRDYRLSAVFNAEHESELPTLARMARDIVGSSQVEDDDLLGKVRALEAHFLAAGRYRYSLNNANVRRQSIDPIEDFVANHRTGHCQYFAGALALMLRSQGIPARLVIGYKGGEFNSVGNYHQVRQLHAHAWVECYFTAEQLRAMERAGEVTEAGSTATEISADAADRAGERLAGLDDLGELQELTSESDHVEENVTGAWLRLDPTPASGDPLAGLRANRLLSRLGHLADYAQLLWNDYVLGLDSQRQRETIYRPLVSGARATLEGLFDRATWEERWAALMRRMGLSAAAIYGPANYLIRLVMGLVLSVGLLAFLFRRRLGAAWGKLLSRGRQVWGHPRASEDFYRRLERLLARLGASRSPGQTPRELVLEVRPKLIGTPYAELPLIIVETFYRMRYGGESLDKIEADQLQHALAAWERELAGKRVS
jgi:hypothetical protein